MTAPNAPDGMWAVIAETADPRVPLRPVQRRDFDPERQRKLRLSAAAMREAVGPEFCRTAGLDDIDESAGIGHIDTVTTCFWTRDRRRVEFTIDDDGQLCFTASLTPDPYHPHKEIRDVE